ncbi:MAG: amphi-Trp domain-containing protein [Oligoflexus sp.]
MQKKAKADQELEKSYTKKQFAAKLRRMADCIEQDKLFRIQVAGKSVAVPRSAEFSIEYEREDDSEELEFQVKWSF